LTPRTNVTGEMGVSVGSGVGVGGMGVSVGSAVGEAVRVGVAGGFGT
jgi:hypothetical protein